MGISQEQLDRAIAAARTLETQGYFERARQGDQRAASYFVRLLAYTLNQSGSAEDYGCLSKSPGETNVDLYAEDAICFTANLSDLQNVADMINGAGAKDASIGGAVKERRPNNRWVKPQKMTDEQMKYLVAGTAPPPPQPAPVVPGREEALDELKWLDAYYAAPEGLQRPNGLSLNGKPDFEGVAAWYLDVYQQARIKGKSRADARAAYVKDIRHSAEWQAKHPGETP